MKVCLLYRDKDWNDIKKYSDDRNIITDLGLQTLFTESAKEVVWDKEGRVKKLLPVDAYIQRTMRSVVMVPLLTPREIIYRQEILADAMREEAFMRSLYVFSTEVLKKWGALGRRLETKSRGTRDSKGRLVTDIETLRHLVQSLSRLKELFKEKIENLKSEGFRELYHRLCEEFSEESEAALRKTLDSVSFYAPAEESLGEEMIGRPRMVLGCDLTEGLKCGNLILEELETQMKKYRNPKSMLSKMQGYINSLTPDSIIIQKSMQITEQAAELEYEVVRHVINSCKPFEDFVGAYFDQLKFQIGFYLGAVNLGQQMKRFGVKYCYPRVVEKENLRFTELKEFIMCMEQRVEPVGNTCDINDRMMLIVTGANQGGKSTFLRSVAIAQIMMQCGLFVPAERYESAIFPSFFTHFTRREDSQMNSGRLDEELQRMNQIIENLGKDSIVMLNESFATTTEKEGSVIAYDITKALIEAGVKVLTVTHLLSYAQKVYAESHDDPETTVEFLSAERLPDGRRTFRMVQHEPELTSFGMDLYEELIGV